MADSEELSKAGRNDLNMCKILHLSHSSTYFKVISWPSYLAISGDKNLATSFSTNPVLWKWIDRLASVFKNNFDRNMIERLPCGSAGKESACKAGDLGFSPEFNPWVGKIPWRREWLATPVFLPGEFHGERRLVGYSPWGHKELDTTKWLTPADSHNSN